MRVSDVADLLDEAATLLELKGENSFKVKAFSNASRVLYAFQGELADLLKQLSENALRGIGPQIAAQIQSGIATGTLPLIEELRAALPAGLLELRLIPGLGAKKITALYRELGIASIAALEEACIKGKVAALKGFGAKTQEKLLKAVELRKAYSGLMLYPEAVSSAKLLIEALNEQGGVTHVEVTGALRRGANIIAEVELLVTVSDSVKHSVVLPDAALVEVSSLDQMERLYQISGKYKVRLFFTSARHAAVRRVSSSCHPKHWQELVGRAQKLGYELTSSVLIHEGKECMVTTEEQLYALLELALIPVELREGSGEIAEASSLFAADRAWPTLVTRHDLRGILHAHTTYSDGQESLENMVNAVRALGMQYFGVCDHSRSAAYAGGLTIDRIAAQHREIEALNKKLFPFKIFKGIESDILVDGALDYPNEILESFDFIVASVHSRFSLGASEMTERLVRAAKNPYTTILGHPSGRRLLQREPYAFDVSKVLRAAADSGAAVEINANPNRLDLDWQYHAKARALGIPLPINPDAHSTEALHDIDYGLVSARKGGLGPEAVLNTMTVEAITQYFEGKRRRSLGRKEHAR